MTTPSKGSVVLATAVLIALLVLMLVNRATSNRIEEAREQMLLDNLSAVLPEGPFDQSPVESMTEHQVSQLGGDQPVQLYTAYRDKQPVAAVLELIAPDGYSGNINMLLGLHPDGDIIALRVTGHKETPGLGDRIEYRKSDWITQFDGQSITSTESVDWQMRQAGGQYDALTGATITSRAIVQSVHRALQWFDDHRDEVFSQ